MKSHDELKAALVSFSRQVRSVTLHTLLNRLAEQLHEYQGEYAEARRRLHAAQDNARSFWDKTTADAAASQARLRTLQEEAQALDATIPADLPDHLRDLELSLSKVHHDFLAQQRTNHDVMHATATNLERSSMSVSQGTIQVLTHIDQLARCCLEFALDQGPWPSIGNVVRHLAGLVPLTGKFIDMLDTIEKTRQSLEDLPQNNREAAMCDHFLLRCELAIIMLEFAHLYARGTFAR